VARFESVTAQAATRAHEGLSAPAPAGRQKHIFGASHAASMQIAALEKKSRKGTKSIFGESISIMTCVIIQVEAIEKTLCTTTDTKWLLLNLAFIFLNSHTRLVVPI